MIVPLIIFSSTDALTAVPDTLSSVGVEKVSETLGSSTATTTAFPFKRVRSNPGERMSAADSTWNGCPLAKLTKYMPS